MPQLHLYVPDDVATELRRRAKERGKTLSSYLADVVRREIATGWPEDFFERVVGGWSGEPLRRPRQGKLEVRDRL